MNKDMPPVQGFAEKDSKEDPIGKKISYQEETPVKKDYLVTYPDGTTESVENAVKAAEAMQRWRDSQ